VTATPDGVADDGEVNEGDSMLPDLDAALLKPRAIAPFAPAPDRTAPSLTQARANTKFISPDGDGRQDVLNVSARFSETTQWTFEVLSGASAIYVENGEGTSMTASWRGRTGLAQRAVSDTYAWRITGRDAAGNQVVARTGFITVDRKLPRVRSLRVRGSRVFMSVSEPATIAARIRRGSALVRRFTPVTLDQKGRVSVTWNGRTERGRPARPGRYRMVIAVRDLAGNITVKTATIRR
jgi:hypothetical protein